MMNIEFQYEEAPGLAPDLGRLVGESAKLGELFEQKPRVLTLTDRNGIIFQLLKSIIRACDKRQVTLEQMDAVVSEIETTMQNSLQNEIPSAAIGEMVMEKLKSLDEVAYVRFASVYRQFKDIGAFMEELNKLLDEKKH